MDPTTQFYIDETMMLFGLDPVAQQALQQAIATLTGIAMRGVLANAPSAYIYARYCADKLVLDQVAAQVEPEFQRYGQFIGVDNPPPPPPTLPGGQS